MSSRQERDRLLWHAGDSKSDAYIDFRAAVGQRWDIEDRAEKAGVALTLQNPDYRIAVSAENTAMKKLEEAIITEFLLKLIYNRTHA